MKQKEKPGSKISTTQTNTNRKKKTENRAGPWGINTSLFKKNETTLIIAGALIVTLVVFFVFFLSPGSRTGQVPPPLDSTRLLEMDTRLATLEQSLAALTSRLDTQLAAVADSGTQPDMDMDAALAKVRRQMATLESGIQARVDALARQIARLEEKKARGNTPIVTVSPDIQEKKPLETAETTALYHTVQKGETLWRISRKYDITVEQLRQLNSLAPGADIYSGTKLRVK